jgi:predicted Zn-dependent protease
MFMYNKVTRYSLAISLLFVLFLVIVTDAQTIDVPKVEYSAAVMPIQSVTQVENDYFDAGSNRSVKQRLYNVERFHMNKSVLENISSGKYQYALNDINFTLRYFPNHPKALQLLTTIAALTKKRALPIPYFEKAINLYPSHAITHAQYGWFFVSIGDLDNGIQKLNYSVQVDPKLTAAYVWLAQAHEKKGDLKLAREARERAKELGYRGNTAGDPSNLAEER